MSANNQFVKVSDVLDVVKKKRTLTEKILLVFPGYRGYREKEILRETDRLIRDVVFRNMKDASEKIRALYREALSTFGGSEQVKLLEKLSMRSDAFSERVRHATYGYAPLMHVVRVDEETLLRLMEFDASLADHINKLKENVEAVRKDIYASKLDPENIRKIEHTLSMLENTFDKRAEVLMGIKR